MPIIWIIIKSCNYRKFLLFKTFLHIATHCACTLNEIQLVNKEFAFQLVWDNKTTGRHNAIPPTE